MEIAERVCQQLIMHFDQQLYNFIVKNAVSKVEQSGLELSATCNIYLDLSQVVWLEKYFTHKQTAVQKVSSVLKKAFTDRYAILWDLAKIPEEGKVPIVALVISLKEELELLLNELDHLLLDVIHIPSLSATLFYQQFSKEIDAFSSKISTNETEMPDVFDLYTEVRSLQQVYDKIDFRLAEKFEMTKWFRSFIRDWLDNSAQRMVVWVNNSLDYDKCERISPAVPYSSSLIDIFTSCQQLLDQVKSLSWPNEQDSQLFYFRLLHQVVDALVLYCKRTIQLLADDLSKLKSIQQAVAPKSAKIGKLKIKMPALRKSMTSLLMILELDYLVNLVSDF